MDGTSALSQKLDKLRHISDNREITADDVCILKRPAEQKNVAASQALTTWGASNLNPLGAASKAVTIYTREAAISILPSWSPPTLKDSLHDVSLQHLVRVLSLTYRKDPSLGTVHAHKSIMDGFVRDQQMLLPRAARTAKNLKGPRPTSTAHAPGQGLDYVATALPGSVQSNDEQLQNLPLRARVIVETFMAEDWKFFELKQQEQLYEAADISICWYQPLSASKIDPGVALPLPYPQFDIYPRLLLLLTLVSIKLKLSEGLFAFFLSPRVADMVESLFWLVHSVLFSPKNTSLSASEVMRIMHPDLYDPSKFYSTMRDDEDSTDRQGSSQVRHSIDSSLVNVSSANRPSSPDKRPPSDAVLGLDGRIHYKPLRLPHHLRPMERNLSSQEYLRNRFADCFVAIERNWLGCRSIEKEKAVEMIPYILCSAVIRGFFRYFPLYAHVFSPHFRLSVYENVIYYLTGVPPYADILQDMRKNYFPSEPHSVESLLQYFPRNTASVINVQTINGYSNPKNLLLGRYSDFTYTPFVDKILETMKHHERSLRSTCTVGEQAAAKEAALKPIAFDIILFPEAEQNTDFVFNVSQSAIRNRSVSPSQKGDASPGTFLYFSNSAIEKRVPVLSLRSTGTSISITPSPTDQLSIKSRHSIDTVGGTGTGPIVASVNPSIALSTYGIANESMLITGSKQNSQAASMKHYGLGQLNAEEMRVNRHKIVRSTLAQLSNVGCICHEGQRASVSEGSKPSRVTSPTSKLIKQPEDISLEKNLEGVSNYGLASLEAIPELKKASVASIVLHSDVVGQDHENESAQAPQAESLVDLLNAHGADTATISGKQIHGEIPVDALLQANNQQTRSLSVDNMFLIRLNQKLQSNSNPKIEGLLGTELVTSSDVVLIEDDENYIKHVNNAMNDAMHPEKLNPALNPHKSPSRNVIGTSPSQSRAESPAYRAEQITKLLPRTTDISKKETIEKLLGNPLGVANQKIVTTRVTPVMIRYLTITGAPAASDFASYIRDSAYLDPSLGQSDALKRVQNWQAGELTQGHSVAIDREISTVKRTRNDPWDKAHVINYETSVESWQMEPQEDSESTQTSRRSSILGLVKPKSPQKRLKSRAGSPEPGGPRTIASDRLSPNRFHLQYEAAKRKLKKQAIEDEKKHKAELVELEVQKELFLNRTLKGGTARAAALSRALVEGDAKDKKQDSNGFISYHSKDNAMVAFLTFRSELQKNLHDLEVAEQLSQKVKQREEARKALSKKMQANKDSLKLLAKKAEAPLVLWPLNSMDKGKANDSGTVEVGMDARNADLRELDFQSYQDIARGEVSSGHLLCTRELPRFLTKITQD